MPQRKRPLGDKYKKVVENIYLKNFPSVVAACRDANLSTKSWYARHTDPDVEKYIEEIKEIKLIKDTQRPEKETFSKSLRNQIFDIVKVGLENKDLKVAELVLRNLDKFEEMDEKGLDLNGLYDLMRESGISLDNIKIVDEDEV